MKKLGLGVGAEVVFAELVKTCPLVSTSVFKKRGERFGPM